MSGTAPSSAAGRNPVSVWGIVGRRFKPFQVLVVRPVGMRVDTSATFRVIDIGAGIPASALPPKDFPGR